MKMLLTTFLFELKFDLYLHTVAKLIQQQNLQYSED